MTRRRLSRRSTVALAAGGLVALSLANPESAAAVDLFPIDNIVRGVIGGAASFTSDQVAGAAVASLLGVVKFLIGDLDKDFGKQMVGFLLGIPDYANPRHAALNRVRGLRAVDRVGASGAGAGRQRAAVLGGRLLLDVGRRRADGVSAHGRGGGRPGRAASRRGTSRRSA